MRRVASAVVMVIAVAACERADREAVAATRSSAERADPANIGGTWQYKTRSNCGSVEGVGRVAFAWNADERAYRETGDVHWSDSGTTIRWWGDATYHANVRTLRATIENSLGDNVAGEWRLEGERPDRLVIEWQQTNGCNGVGIATR